MYVCICHAVTDSKIEEAIDNGAESMKQLSTQLNVATQCGQCTSCVKKILNNKLIQISEIQPEVA